MVSKQYSDMSVSPFGRSCRLSLTDSGTFGRSGSWRGRAPQRHFPSLRPPSLDYQPYRLVELYPVLPTLSIGNLIGCRKTFSRTRGSNRHAAVFFSRRHGKGGCLPMRQPRILFAQPSCCCAFVRCAVILRRRPSPSRPDSGCRPRPRRSHRAARRSSCPRGC